MNAESGVLISPKALRSFFEQVVDLLFMSFKQQKNLS